MKCSVCGLPLLEVAGRRGRPRLFHSKCRKIEQLFSWLEDLLSTLEASPSAHKDLRSRLWSLANLFNKKRKG